MSFLTFSLFSFTSCRYFSFDSFLLFIFLQLACSGHRDNANQVGVDWEDKIVQVYDPQRLDLDLDAFSSHDNDQIILALKTFMIRATRLTTHSSEALQIRYNDKKSAFSYKFYQKIFTTLLPRIYDMDAKYFVDSMYYLAIIYKTTFPRLVTLYKH